MTAIKQPATARDVRIMIRLRIDPAEGVTEPELRSGVENLAGIMLVQAEDGIWTLGSPDAWADDGSVNLPLAALVESAVLVTT